MAQFFASAFQNYFMQQKFLAAATALAFFGMSCRDADKSVNGSTTITQTDTSTTVTSTPSSTVSTSSDTVNANAQTSVYREGTRKTITVQELPAPVSKTYQAKYAKVQNPVWYVYTPVAEDYMDENNYYVVTVPDKSGDYYVWYNEKGDFVKEVRSMKKDSRLPDAVNKTINEQYPGYTIESIDKENDKDMDMYEIKMVNGDQKAKLKILPDGTIFKRKEKTK